MQPYVNKWKKFLNKTKLQESHNIKKQRLLEDYDVLSEISRESADKIYDWMASAGASDYSFNDLFGGAMRIAFPLATDAQRKLKIAVTALADSGWSVGEMVPWDGGMHSSKKFPIKKVKQKRTRLATAGGGEYEEEIEVADLVLSRTYTKVIPAGPRKGEEIQRTDKTSMSKALAKLVKGGKLEQELYDWWQKTQVFYTKDNNWQDIEGMFSGDIDNDVVIVSRHPVDVLRMSDMGSIRSCHSEGSGYFKCAVAEAKGHGPIAYVVSEVEYERLLREEHKEYQTADDPEAAFDMDAPAEEPSEKKLSDFDDEEIFRDRQRQVRGITPKARVRLRKYVNDETDEAFAVPELRTYGAAPPGFTDAVLNWAWDNQKKMFELGTDVYGAPNPYSLTRYGGSWEDNPDGQLLRKFFGKGIPDFTNYNTLRNVSRDYEGENEDEAEQLFNEYEERIDELNDHANSTLQYCSVHGSVEDTGDGMPYVYASGDVTIEIPIKWDGPMSDEPNGYYWHKDDRDMAIIPKAWGSDYQSRRAFERAIEDKIDVYSEETNWEIREQLGGARGEPDKTYILEIRMQFNCDDCDDPDSYENFIDYIESDIDSNYDEIREKIRRSLVEETYIPPDDWDNLQDEIEEMGEQLKNFTVIGDDPDSPDGEAWFTLQGEGFSGTPDSHITTGAEFPWKTLWGTRHHNRGWFARAFDPPHITTGDLRHMTRTVFGITGDHVNRGYQNLEGSKLKVLFMEKLHALEKAAGDWASSQMSLDFGEKYKAQAFKGVDLAKDTKLTIGFHMEENRFVQDVGYIPASPVNIGYGMKIVVSQANSREELLGAFEFVRFVDKHADMVHEAMAESVKDMIAQAISKGREDRAHVGDIKRKYEALIAKIKESDLEQSDKSYWIDRANTDILGAFIGHRPANATARNPGPDQSNVIGLSKSIDDAIQQQAIDAERQSWDDAMKDEEPPDAELPDEEETDEEKQVREALREGIKNYKLNEERQELFSNPQYITEVLGIQLPLNESYPYSAELNEQILQEQILLEGFLGDLKKMGGAAKQLFSTLGQLIKDPAKVKEWINSVWKLMVKTPLAKLVGLLTTLKDKLPEVNLPKFAAIASKAYEMISNIVTKVKGMAGWKGAMSMTALGLAFKWLWDKIGDVIDGAKEKAIEFIQGKALEELKSWLQGTVFAKGIEVIQNKLKEVLAGVASSLTGIGAWFSFAKKAFDGASFVLGALEGPLGRMSQAAVSESKEEQIIREAVKKAIKQQKKLLSEREDPNYKQYLYELHLNLDISKTKGGDKQETLTDIRAIPGVTTVTATTSVKDPYVFVSDVLIRFSLNTREAPTKYIRETLAPALRKIRGLSNIRIKGISRG